MRGDFETHDVGTGERLKQLEAEVVSLRARDLGWSMQCEELQEALEAIEKTTFIGVSTASEQTIRVALESAHDIAHSALHSDDAPAEPVRRVA